LLRENHRECLLRRNYPALPMVMPFNGHANADLGPIRAQTR
jgi:hypothetical protein